MKFPYEEDTRCEAHDVSVSAILFLSYKIRADVLSSALIPLIR